RSFLEEGLKQAGLKVFPSETNFILVYSEMPVYEYLLERGILIRDCKNFRGLGEGFYRIAVKTRKENEMLLKMI
ncbi:Thr-phospho decarboxylase, partial [Klebsiella oxytoca]